ncbi:hypothetical protein Tco_0082716, partial [Tanacetum coccineum]
EDWYAGLGIKRTHYLVMSWRGYAISSLLDMAYGSIYEFSSNVFILVPELRLLASSSQITPKLLQS